MEVGACKGDLNCAVCLQVYRDPVTLPCRHSFCLKCIEDVWTQEVNQDGFSCPRCHRKFNSDTSLQRGIPIVACDHCGENQSPAVKTCLKCETSFCPLHLKPHLTKEIFKDHVLVNPVADLTQRKCPAHKKILEFFCTDDVVCVCSSCGVIGTHKSHSMVSLDETEVEFKREFMIEVENLRRFQHKCSIKQHDLEKSEVAIKTLTNELKGNLSKKFLEWSQQLEEDEKHILKLIDHEGLRVLAQIQNCSEALSKAMQQIKLIEDEAWNLTQGDCLYFIQNSKELLSRVIEIQKVTYPDAPELTLNLSNVYQLLRRRTEESKQYYLAIEDVIVMHKRPKSTGNILKGENEHEEPTVLMDSAAELRGYIRSPQNYSAATAIKTSRPIEIRPRFSTKAQKVIVARQWLSNLKSNGVKNSFGESKEEFPRLTLDLKTANKHLILSDDLQSVMHRHQEQPYSSNPLRFQTHSQVLCIQSFFCGRHTWDVETNGNWWGVGIAYGGIQKTGSSSDLRKTTKAWCLYFCISTLSAHHNDKVIHLPLKRSISRIRVQLDYDAGTLSFYQVTDTLTHVYTFEATFTGHVYPAFCCEANSGLKIF
ncbi:E3 ubiquitin/ISG15 ligase TRIM25-like [Scyliorhinus torazame]|uniref:E3 ubiquitin/ISG15 ligase TRIM25-like n=1 Tax=Scyliorhinus torazame TaxID=75743 RepID=UPI003B5B95C9